MKQHINQWEPHTMTIFNEYRIQTVHKINNRIHIYTVLCVEIKIDC